VANDVHDTRTRSVQLAAVFSYVLLIMLTLAWEGWLSPTGRPGLWLTLKSLPLLVPLFGLLRGQLRSYVVASLLSLVYMTEGLVVVWMTLSLPATDDRRFWLASLEVFLTVTCVVAATLFVRWRRRQGASLRT